MTRDDAPDALQKDRRDVKTVLPYRAPVDDARSRGCAVAIILGVVLGLAFGLPLVLVGGVAALMRGPDKAEGLICVAIAAPILLLPLFTLSRHLERGGRPGVLPAALITGGVCLLASGVCFVVNL